MESYYYNGYSYPIQYFPPHPALGFNNGPIQPNFNPSYESYLPFWSNNGFRAQHPLAWQSPRASQRDSLVNQSHNPRYNSEGHYSTKQVQVSTEYEASGRARRPKPPQKSPKKPADQRHVPKAGKALRSLPYYEETIPGKPEPGRTITQADRRRHNIAEPYLSNMELWNPDKKPIFVFEAVYDVASLGYQIYVWAWQSHGRERGFVQRAGTLRSTMERLWDSAQLCEELCKSSEKNAGIKAQSLQLCRYQAQFSAILEHAREPSDIDSSEDDILCRWNFMERLLGHDKIYCWQDDVRGALKAFDKQYRYCHEEVRKDRKREAKEGTAEDTRRQGKHKD